VPVDPAERRTDRDRRGGQPRVPGPHRIAVGALAARDDHVAGALAVADRDLEAPCVGVHHVGDEQIRQIRAAGRDRETNQEHGPVTQSGEGIGTSPRHRRQIGKGDHGGLSRASGGAGLREALAVSR
jgi:hypothetical protein